MIKKSDFLWNMLYTGLLSTLNFVIVLVCVRINGVEIAGKVAILFATATIIATISEYGLRLYQVTDTNRKYNFSEYILTRLILIIVMFIISIITIEISKYDNINTFIFISLIISKAIDNLSDTFQGELQLEKKMNIASKFAFFRVATYILAFIITDILTKDILLSFGAMSIVNILLFFLFDLYKYKIIKEKKFLINDKIRVINILKECFNIFIFTILSTYIINAVKYVIDARSTYEIQTYYNVICLPMFVLNLLCIFITKPYLEPISNLFASKKYEMFKKYIKRIIGVILLATVIVLIILYTIGGYVLEKIYKLSFDNYRLELIIIGLTGGIYAVSVVLYNALVMIRKTKSITIVYMMVFLFSYAIKYVDIGIINIRKAVILNLIILTMLCVLSTIEYFRQIRKNIKMVNES